MKAIQAVVMLVLALQAARASTSNPPVCSLNPVFLKFNKMIASMAFQTPIKNSANCQPEWAIYGTCCEVQTLKLTVLYDQNTIKTGLSKLVNNFYQLDAHLKFAINNLTLLTKSKGYQLADSQTKASVDAFLKVASTTTSSSFKSSLESCWPLMAKARAASMCSFCSGRSSDFFINGKLSVAASECSRIVETCSFSLFEMARVSEIAQKTRDVLLNIGKLDITTCELNPGSRWDFVLNRVTSIFCSSSGQLASCNDVRNQKLPTTLTSWLCSNYVRLQGPTILEEMVYASSVLIDAFRESDRIFNFIPSIGLLNDWTRLDTRSDFLFTLDESLFIGSLTQTSDWVISSSITASPRNVMNLSLEFP